MNRYTRLLALLLALLMMVSFAASCQPTGGDESSSLPGSSSSEISSEQEREESSSEEISEEKSEETTEISSSVLEESSIPLPEMSSVSNQISSKPVSSAAPSKPVSSVAPSKPVSSTKPSESSSKNEDDWSLPTDDMPQLCDPILTGDFIQGWYYSGWDYEDWVEHFTALKEVGITSLILQYDVYTDDCKIYRIDFEHDIPDSYFTSSANQYTHILEDVLSAAKETGCKVWIGLGVADDWWTETNHWDADWRSFQCEVNKMAMDAIKKYYYEEYKDQIEGLYWANEMYTQDSGLEDVWADMISKDLDYLTETGMDLPMMMAPYNSEWYVTKDPSLSAGEDYKLDITPEEAEKMWTTFVQKTRFRDGDVFCPMDSINSSALLVEDAVDFLISMKNAVEKSNVDLQFWIDAENFTDGGWACSMDTLRDKLKICSKLATRMVCFSYTHYYLDDYSRHTAYKRYYKAVMD